MKKNYNDSLHFEESPAFELPDFSIRLLGETKIENEKYVEGFFIYYDYKISSETSSVIVSWTSGTGFTSPGSFEFEGKKWVLDVKSKKILP